MKRILFVVMAAVLAAGCSGYRQVRVDDLALGGFEFKGTSSAVIRIDAKVSNPSRHALSLESVDAVLVKEGKDFIAFSLDGCPSAAPCSDTTVVIPIRASVVDPIAIISSGLDFRSWDQDQFLIEGKAVVKADNGIKKTLRFRRMPLKEFLDLIK